MSACPRRRPPVRARSLLALVLVSAGAFLGGSAQAERALVVYPGSFDPFHLAHRAELEATLRQLAPRHPDGIDVVVLPNHDTPRHVPKGYTLDAALREQLARIGTMGLPGVRVHAAFPDGTETVDQLLAVKGEHAGGRAYLLLGDDAYAGLGAWKDAARLLPAYDVVVSTPSARLGALRTPAGVLGALGQGFRGDGAARWVRADGARVEALAIDVPEVRSHEVLLRLLTGRRVDRLVGAAAERALRTRPFRAAIERSARRLLVGSQAAIAELIGPALAARVPHDGAVATSLLALSNTDDPKLLRRVAHNLRRRGLVVSMDALQRLARAPAHARIFQLPGQRPRQLARKGRP